MKDARPHFNDLYNKIANQQDVADYKPPDGEEEEHN